MQSTDGQQAFETTMGAVRDPWTPLAVLRRERGVIAGDEVPNLSGAAAADDPTPRFAVLRYDDCARVLRDNTTFSSRVYEGLMGPVMGHTILEMDEPEHRRFRSLAGHAFRQKTLERWETELIEPLAHETIDRFALSGEAELVNDLTFPFPVQVIARILGLPHEDYPRFQQLAFTLTSVGAGYEGSIEASRQLAEILTPIVQARRADPADDLISELASAESDGETLTDEEIVSYLRLLLPAGSETTYCSIGSLLLALLTHTDQLDAVRADRALLPQAIEEGLRWEPPLLTIMRTSSQATSVCGVDLPAGAVLVINMGAANHDDKRWEDADSFNIFRPQTAHVAFASGPHMCLGMHLARMETKVALNRIFDRLPNLRLDPDAEPPYITGMTFRSPPRLEVVFD
ncbi:MAG: hypothetical protein QOG30_610 [Acidimicrobiaceae bacterium]